jgi:hypothetical protein
LSFGSPGSGVKRQNSVVRVIPAAKEDREFHLPDLAAKGGEFLHRLGGQVGIFRFLGQFQQNCQILSPFDQGIQPFNRSPERGRLFQGLLGRLLVIPEVRRRNLGFKLLYAFLPDIWVKETS